MTETLVAPAHLWVPPHDGTFGDEAADLSAAYGRPLDPEQRTALDAMLAYRLVPGGAWVWAALENAVVEARQNGKTDGPLLASVMCDLYLLDADKVIWTAHLFKTAREAFESVKAAIEYAPELSRRTKKITEANGEEGVELHSGARLDFVARSKGGGRGLGGKHLVFDEALFLSAASMGALIPTLSARSVTGNPRLDFGASAGLGTSDHLRSLRDRGRAGGDASLTWVEFCAPGGWDEPGCELHECDHRVGRPGCSLDNEDFWAVANPALGRRISLDYVRSERRAMPPEEFGRERLGWWDEPDTADPAFPPGAWERCKDADSTMATPTVLAVDVSPNRSTSVIAVAGLTGSGKPQLEITGSGSELDWRPGVDWVVPRVVEIARRHRIKTVVLDATVARSLHAALEADGLSVLPVGPSDMAGACGHMHDAVTAGRLVHLGQIDDVLPLARRRDVGDSGWAWGRRRSNGDITPLVAVTLALWGLSRVKPPRQVHSFS